MLPEPTRAFTFEIRRRPGRPTTFSARFHVTVHHGFMMLMRSGQLNDTPPSRAWKEESLTAVQLRASRFVLADQYGESRHDYSLATLSDELLESLPPGRWIRLLPRRDGSRLVLEPAISSLGAHAPTQARRRGDLSGDDMSDLPTDPRAVPISAIRKGTLTSWSDEHTTDAGSGIMGGPTSRQAIGYVLKERNWADTNQQASASALDAPEPQLAEVHFGNTAEDEIRSIMDRRLASIFSRHSSGSPGERRPTGTPPGSRPVTSNAGDSPGLPPTSPSSGATPGDPLFLPAARSTVLIRHLRRRLQEKQLEIDQLNARLAEMAKALGDRAGPSHDA